VKEKKRPIDGRVTVAPFEISAKNSSKMGSATWMSNE